MSLIPTVIKRRLWRYLTRRMNLHWTLRSGLSIAVKDFADWCTYNEIFASREYDKALERMEETVAPGQPAHVLDLGANTGFFALCAMDRWALRPGTGPYHYIGVEASPETARDLESRLAQCRSERTTVKVANGLVGQREGMGRLRIGRESNLNTAQEPGTSSEAAWAVSRGTLSVPWIDLNQVLGSWSAIDLIKCDIEGSEFAFIASYPEILSRTKWLVIEFHHAFGSVEEACGALKKLGLEIRETLREAHDVRVVLFQNRSVAA